MQAVITAAGYGKRLKPYTDNMPKPMVPVLGKPILVHTFSSLPDDVDEVILVVGYKREHIIERFGHKFGRRKIRYVRQTEALGTFNALLTAKSELNGEPFLVLFGDDIYAKEDVEKLLKYEHALLVKEVKDVSRFGACFIDERMRLLRIDEKPSESESNLVNIGVYKLAMDIFNEPIAIGPVGEDNLPVMIGNLAKTVDIFVEKAEFWAPIAYPEDIKKAEEILRRRKCLQNK